MSRKIPLHRSQQIPDGWETNFPLTDIPTEEELLPRQEWMDDDYYDRNRLNFNSKALVYSTMHALAISVVPTITHLSAGAWNTVFLIEFPNGPKVVARIPHANSRFPRRIESTVATMTLARYYRHIPAPDVNAWHGENENAVGAPYIIQEWVGGIEPWEVWDRLPHDGHVAMLDELSRHHAAFAAPLPFQGLGSIFFAEGLPKDSVEVDLSAASTYRVGPYVPGPTCTPYREGVILPQSTSASLTDFWIQLWTKEVDFITQNHGTDRSTVIATEDHPSYSIQDTYTLGQFLDIAQAFRTIIENCSLPPQPELSELCFVPTDYAFRNIKINAETHKVSSFLDWDDVTVMPFLLCTRFPEDISTCSRAPQSWEAAGGFEFLPPDEEGPEEILQDKGEEIVTTGVVVKEEADGSDGSDAVEGPSSPALSTEGSEDSSDSEHTHESPPPPPPPDPEAEEAEMQKTCRRYRIADTHFRRRYMGLLSQYDSRYSTEGLWQMREDPMKIQYLVMRGWTEWLAKGDWLKEREKHIRCYNQAQS